MTDTPWGPAEDLRKRMLRPGRGQVAEETARNQRERLFGAMVATVAEKGYEQTTVADLIQLSGVSRSAFYREFDDKQSCFMATYEAMVEGILAVMTAEFDTGRPWPARLGGAFERLLEAIAAQPAAAHMCLVDLYAAGPEVIDHSGRVGMQIERQLRRVLDESPQRAELPRPVLRGLIGGTYKVITSRVRRGLGAELPGLVPEIAGWALGYHTPPGTIRRQRSQSAVAGSGPQFGPYGVDGRIFDAVAIEIADHGYQATTIEGIATQAGASAHTFYKHFDSKLDAFLAAYDAGLTQAFALVQPAFERAPDWPHALRAALHALLVFLAGDPAWARTAIVESPGAGPPLMERADNAIDRFSTLLEPGLDEAPDLGQVAVEASAGAIYGLVYDQIRRVGPARLPEALPACTYVGLAPFIGAERALAVANDGGRSRRRAGPAGRRPGR